jgi:hypothetical protein
VVHLDLATREARSPTWSLRFFFALLALAVAGTVSAGASVEGWSPPTNISNSGGESKRPAVAVGVDGALHVVWEDQSPGNWEVLYASKEAGGDWSPPSNVSNNPGGSFRPAVAVGPDGSVHVAWHDDTFGNYEILYATKPPGGEWSTPTNISNSSGWSYWPSIAVGADGSVYVAWHDDTPGNWEVMSASRAPDGPWSPATNLSESAGTSFIPKLFPESDGSINAVWQDNTSRSWDIFSASRPPGGPWSAAVNISSSDGDSAPFAAAQSADGSLRVVWREAASGGLRLLSATKSPGGPWSSPEDVSGPVGGSGPFLVGTGKDEALYLLWDDLTLGNQEVFFASRAAGGPWSPPFNVSESPADSTLGGLATGSDGSLHMVWQDGPPGKGDIFYSERFAAEREGGAAPPEGMGVVRLTRGCNRVTSSYPDSTAADALADAVSPAHALVSLWKREAGDWLGYSPSYPSVSDLFRQDFQALFFICTSGEAEFLAPL